MKSPDDPQPKFIDGPSTFQPTTVSNFPRRDTFAVEQEIVNNGFSYDVETATYVLREDGMDGCTIEEILAKEEAEKQLIAQKQESFNKLLLTDSTNILPESTNIESQEPSPDRFHDIFSAMDVFFALNPEVFSSKKLGQDQMVVLDRTDIPQDEFFAYYKRFRNFLTSQSAIKHSFIDNRNVFSPTATMVNKERMCSGIQFYYDKYFTDQKSTNATRKEFWQIMSEEINRYFRKQKGFKLALKGDCKEVYLFRTDGFQKDLFFLFHTTA